MKLKVLIVEDEGPIGDLLQEAITNRLTALSHEPSVQRCRKIPESKSMLEEFRPHIVTLDLKDESTDDIAAGKPAWEFIRDAHFCPVVFFSANALPEGFPQGDDPFAQYLNKNEKQPEDVAATIEGFIPHVVGLEGIRCEIESRYAKALQKVSSLIWKSETDPEARKEALIRVTRRRLAATLEHPLGEEKNIKAWEQFIYPPMEDHLCTGDVVFRIGGDRRNAEDFRIILTPPCDLVTSAGRTPVEDVLMGRFLKVTHAEILRANSLKMNADLPRQIASRLKKDRMDSKLVFPRLADQWPAMVLDFKALETVALSAIAPFALSVSASTKFERIASMDSPFREALSWRFTHSVGRPGYPAVDEESLGNDVEAEAGKV